MTDRIRARLDWLLVAVGVVVLLLGPSYYFYGDGFARYQALTEFDTHGTVTAMKYSFIGPLGAWPLYTLGATLDGLLGGHWWRVGTATDGWTATYQLTARYNALLWLAALAVLAWALRGAVSDTVRRRFVLLLLAGTLASNHLRFFHGEVFTVVLVGAGLAVVYLRMRGGWAWPAVLLGVANLPAHLPAFGLVALRRTWESRRLRYLLLPLAAAVLIVLEAHWRLGGWLKTGYADDAGLPQVLQPYAGRVGFSYPLGFGLLGLLLSFGKGLVYFAPGLLLPGWRRLAEPAQAGLRACYTQWLLYLGGLVLVYATWWSWYGGWSFGPRFLILAALPASLALALYLERPSPRLLVNVAVLALLLLSLWVGACGAVFGLDGLEWAGPGSQFRFESLVWHVPEHSVLWHPFMEHRPLDWQDLLVLGYAGVLAVVLGAGHAVAIGRALGGTAWRVWSALRNGPTWKV